MKKTNNKLAIFSVIVATSILGSVIAFANQEDVWKQIENSYYCETTDMTEKGSKNELNYDIVDGNARNEGINKHELNLDKLDIDILGGGTLDTSSITKFYKSKNSFRNLKGIKEFKQLVKDNGLFSALEFDNKYWAIAKRDQDSKPSTAIIREDEITQLFLNDSGEIYDINLDATLRDKLSSSNLDLSKTKAYFVLLRGLAETIVFDDGENQLIQIKGSCQDFMDEGSILTIDELFLIIDENIDELTFSYNFIIGSETDEKTIEYGG